MTVSVGSKLSFYEILAPLGAGAMGEVWRARDTKLGREVAIKVLPEHFADDPDRLRRFEREAKSLATVNHPNVAQIFGVDQVGDTCFLVLELVTGEPLDERLKRGPLPIGEALDVCRQIAEGLEAAHEAGVIHRDLKPANVRITPEGKVKLLDFGLAKPANEGKGGSSTDSVLSTEAGRLLGTPTYMAPEQARGKPIDKRVDIWAFGCVLYECLTGKRAFDGETLTDVLGAVLHTEPDLARLRKDTPPRVRELLADCLVKDPHARARDIGEVRRQLERARTEPTSYAPSGRSRRREWIAWGATAIAVLGCIFLALRRPTAPPAAPVVRTHINLPPDLRLGGEDGSLALSPDGGTLVLCASRREQPLQLWVRPLESLMLQPLSDTSGATYPFWSPDGRTIAFFADGKLKRIPAGGGSVTTVCDAADPRGGTWTTRDEIVFAPAPFGGLLRVQSAGGVPQAITKADGSVSHRVPHALPDGRRLLFSQTNSERDGILLVDLDSGAITPVSDASSDAHFVAPGELLFVRDGNLVGQPFDLSAGRLTGQPRLVVERVPFITARVSGRYSASSEGTLVYQPVAENRLEWFDLEGHSQGRIGGPGAYQFVSVSPDGRRVSAIVSRPDGGDDTWLIDGQSGLGVAQPGLANTFGMAWSPDSRSIAFSRPDDHFSTYISALDGSAKPQRAGNGGPFDWSRDGSWLSVVRQVPGTGLDVLVTRADGTGEPQVIAATAANEIGGIFSPDSRWLLFVSDPGGRDELFLAPIGRPGATRPITNIGVAGPPAWLDDGRIVFRARSGELYEMDTKARGDELEVGTPRLSFGGRKLPGVGVGGDYSITRDGRRLLAIVADVGAGEPPLILVQHGQGGGGR